MPKGGLGVVPQRGIMVIYDDLLVKDRVIVELKVVGALGDVHVPQCRNDLRATGNPPCLLINFGQPKVESRRISAGP